MFRYASRICSLVKRASMSTASSASRIFRQRLRFGVRKKFFASCWVMVDPPCTIRIRRRFAPRARRIPIMSMPKCE